MSNVPIDQFDNVNINFIPFIAQLRGDTSTSPDASIVIPVNARADLKRVLNILLDIISYKGTFSIELIFVINNYNPESPPVEIERFRSLGICVIDIPHIEFSEFTDTVPIRAIGARAAKSDVIISFDADCRLNNATVLIDWYIEQFRNGVNLAYTHVDYYELPNGLSVNFRMFIHHFSRWLRRTILRIPTNRGSNYAIRRSVFLDLFDRGLIVSSEVRLGLAIKSAGGKIVYSPSRNMTVLTSGRWLSGGWQELIQYLIWRTGYYFRVSSMQAQKEVDASMTTKNEIER